MKLSFAITAYCAAIAGAVPFSSTHSAVHPPAPPHTEIEVLNFILSLEHFQNAFYQEGLANFTSADFAEYGFGADFYSNLTEIASHEHTHVTSLIETLHRLNATPVAACDYFFNVTSPALFVAYASLIESVSVSSYIGLLSNLTDTAFLKVFSSVLAVEARHSAFIRAALGNQPFPSPYDTPTDFDETYTLVQLFTVSCPKKNPLALKNYPTLSSSFANHGVIGREVTFLTFGRHIKAGSDSKPIYAAFLTLTGPIFAPTIRLPNNAGFNTTVPAIPKGYVPINGLTYVVLTSSNKTLTDDNILAGPATIEVYLK